MKDNNRKAMWVKINHNNVNQTEVDDIVLTQENDGDFYRRVLSPNTDVLAKRMVGNRFTIHEALNKKGFVERIGREAVNDYFKKFGGTPVGITPDTKKKVGQELIETMVDRAREQARVHPKVEKGNKRYFRQNESSKRIIDDERIRKGMRF